MRADSNRTDRARRPFTPAEDALLERQIIKRVLRGGEPAGELLEQARQRMADAAAVSEADLTKRLEPWLEYEIGALAERLPGRHGEPHEANREAMA